MYVPVVTMLYFETVNPALELLLIQRLKELFFIRYLTENTSPAE